MKHRPQQYHPPSDDDESYSLIIKDHPQRYPPPSDDQCCISFFIILIFFIFPFLILMIFVSLNEQNMQISVSSASLSKFSYNSSFPRDQLITFNLLTNLTFRNPNKFHGINYDWLQVKADYNGVQFSWSGLPVFYLERKGAREVAVELYGRSTFGGGGGNVTDGVFQTDLWVFGQIWLRCGCVSTGTRLVKAVCSLKLSL